MLGQTCQWPSRELIHSSQYQLDTRFLVTHAQRSASPPAKTLPPSLALVEKPWCGPLVLSGAPKSVDTASGD